VLRGARLSLFLDEPTLLPPFRAGDSAVLERVYYCYVDLVSAVVRRYGNAPSDYADLVQETFIRAFGERARLAYDGLRLYRPLLVTICRNIITDWARRIGRELSLPEALEVEADVDDVDVVDPVLRARVDAYLAALAPSLRGVYEQRYVHDASQEEAARVLGISRQQLRTLEQKLRDGLARSLEKR
jgi:RNA polymerase sigma factor (sigma-70 family)